MLDVNPRGFLYRFVAALAGVTVACFGVAAFARGGSSYANWFGGLVFAPFAVLFGGFAVFCAVFKPDWLQPKEFKSKRRGR
jgi:hypothetical protein